MTTDHTELKNKPEAAIEQINLGYNTQQDRLLLRVGLSDNTELIVWLTNRITKQLWNLLNGETHLPTADSIALDATPQQAVAQFNQELQASKALENLDFSSQYQARQDVVNDGAMLAITVLLMHHDNRPASLELPCLEGITVRMNLTNELILALCNMLQLSCKEAGWDLGVVNKLPAIVMTQNDEKKVLH